MSDRSGRSGGSSRRVDSAHPARPLSLTPISGQSPVRADGAFRRLGGHVSRLAKWLGRTSAPPRVDRLVVGLGNPGDGYANTRHNVGFQVANRLAKRARLEFDTKAAESRIAEGSLGDLRIAIARPQTFMNDSGRAVGKLLDRYRLTPDALLVIFDEVDLPLGKVRLRDRAERLENRRSTKIADATAGARAFAWASLVQVSRRTVVVVAPSEDRARRWRAELAAWLGEDRVLSFPERETMPYEIGSASAGAVHQRLLTLWRAHTAPEPVAVVASLRALMQHTIAPADLRERGRTLRAGDHVSWNATAEWLFELGYEPVAEVSEPGSFSRRGGILDVYPASGDMLVRIELFGDDIETLRRFDPVTQRSQDTADSVDSLPAREDAPQGAAAPAARR